MIQGVNVWWENIGAMNFFDLAQNLFYQLIVFIDKDIKREKQSCKVAQEMKSFLQNWRYRATQINGTHIEQPNFNFICFEELNFIQWSQFSLEIVG